MGVAREETRGACTQFLAYSYLVILCFERRYPKQSTVVRLKSNVLSLPIIFLTPKSFGLTTPAVRRFVMVSLAENHSQHNLDYICVQAFCQLLKDSMQKNDENFVITVHADFHMAESFVSSAHKQR